MSSSRKMMKLDPDVLEKKTADGVMVVEEEHGQIGDESSSQPQPHQIFFIDLTLKEILKNLEVPDLLNVSLLNRYFHHNAVAFLKESRKCIAVVKGDQPCELLLQLETLLQSSSNIPYNGLSVTTTEESHSCIECSSASEKFPVLLNKLHLKYLKVDWKWSLDTSCPAQQLLRIYLKEKTAEFKELTIRELPWGEFSGNYAFNQDNPGTWLKNLKVLEFSTDVEIDLIEKILPCAPQLKEIRGRVFPEHLKFLIPQKKIGLIKDFRFYPELSTTDLIAQFALESPRLESMEISSDELRRDDVSMETFKIVLRLLLEASSTSLKKLRIDEHLDILWFSNLQLPTLHGLTQLLLHYELDLDKQIGYSSLSRINWDRLFPNLTSVEISFGITPYQLLMRYVNEECLRNSPQYVCRTVTKLTLPDQGRCFQDLYTWLSQVFPCLKHLQAIIYMEYPQHLTAICTYWPELETVFINFKTRTFKYNIDSALAGITPEETEELRKKEPSFLKEFHFVPVQPCIITMKKLKQLRISQLHHHDCYRGPNPDIKLMSELTDHLVFSKMPQVKIEASKRDCKNGQCLAF